MATDDLTSLPSAREKFLENLKAKSRSISTILAYGKDVEQLVSFLTGQKITQVSSVEKTQIEAFKEYLSTQNYTPKTISRKLNAVKTFFRFLKAEGVINDDPSSEITHPKYETQPPRILSRLEYRALRDACRGDTRIGAIVELMLQTGIRIGEVSRLEMADVSPHELRIKAYESQPARSIPLNKSARIALDRYLEERPKTKVKNVFATKTGRPLLVRNIRTAVDRYFRLAGIKNARVNDLRNTWIVYHLLAGTSALFLSKMAGHKRLSSTEKFLAYIHQNPKSSARETLKEL